MSSRTALITGAASGIGAAIARQLSMAGYKLILVDRDSEPLQRVCDEMQEAAIQLVLDITDSAAVDSLPTNIDEDFLPINVLVNAAGHDPGGTTRFDLGDPDDWDSAIQTNLIGTMRVTRALLPEMVARNQGDIINIGSIAGIRIMPDMVAYTTSKAGIHAFSDMLRADLQDSSIRVTEILPGLTKTDLIRKRYGGDEQRAQEYYERFKMALDPEDIAQAVEFVLSAPQHAVLAQMVILPNNRW